MHFKTKHIQICHHFIRDHAQRNDITLKFIQTGLQLVDTKPLDGKWFTFIRRELGMLDSLENDLS